MTKQQKEEIKEVLGKPPSEPDLPKAFWDVPTPPPKKYLSATFRTVYEIGESVPLPSQIRGSEFQISRHVRSATRRNGYRKKNRGNTQGNQALTQRPGLEVFASDEVRVELEALTRKAWLKRGERTVVKVDRSGNPKLHRFFEPEIVRMPPL